METSEQQRRPAIGRFVKTLADTKLDFDAIDLVDMLWLAQFIKPGEGSSSKPNEPEKPASSPKSISLNDLPSESSALNLYPQESLQSSEQSGKSVSEPAPQTTKGVPFSVPSAPALRTRLDLARSLRPLMRKVPSRSRLDLDEDATVTRIAETEVWIPVERPRPERWLELDLVVEASKTTVIWERAIAELNHLAEYQGAFRTVRTWRLYENNGRVQLFPRWREQSNLSPSKTNLISSQRPHTPKELIDPMGRKLIWLVTDCTSRLWKQDPIYKTLVEWTAAQPVAIVQMFPQKLWSRTALRNGHIVRLSALAPGLPSSRLEIEGLPQRLERRRGHDLVNVPIVSLDAIAMQRWARVTAGIGESTTPGRVFDRVFIRRQAAKGKEDVQRSQLERTAQERVAVFRSTASKTVQQLAMLMAATPVSLPVIDLLRDAFRGDFDEEVQQSHVAEVLLSGLLRRCDTEGDAVCRYQFFGDDLSEPRERVRDILLGDAKISKTREVLDVLSASILGKLGSPAGSFQALLDELQNSTQESDLRNLALPFARIGLDVLRRLGGEHAALARSYNLDSSTGRVHQLSTDDFPLEDIEYEVAQFTNFPPLQTCEYQSATITAILDRFDFETVTLVRGIEPSTPTENSWNAVEGGYPPAAEFELPPATEFELPPTAEFELPPAVEGGYSPPTGPDYSSSSELDDEPTDDETGWEQEARWLVERTQSSAWGYTEILSAENGEEIGLDMIAIPAGSFRMGAPERELGRDDERPPHGVLLQSFYMGRYPITQAQWRVVAGYEQIDRELDSNPSRFKGDNRPVESVSWEDAQEFCRRLSAKTRKDYRLPSEAQWEYACRAGTTTPFHFGEVIVTELANYDSTELANYDGNNTYNASLRGEYRGQTTDVGSFPANDWGLYDMHGNVWEWCEDDYHSSYEGAPNDGSGWVETDRTETERILRGGSWAFNPRYCRSAARIKYACNARYTSLGLRVCCELSMILP